MCGTVVIINEIRKVRKIEVTKRVRKLESPSAKNSIITANSIASKVIERDKNNPPVSNRKVSLRRTASILCKSVSKEVL